MDWLQSNRAPRSYDWYKERIERFLKVEPTILVSEITPHHVQRWLDKQKTWSDSYKNGVVTSLKRVFNWAVKQGLVNSNPIQGLEKPQAKHRESPVTEKEYRTVLENTPDQDFRDVVEFLWAVGCRPQEMNRLRPDDLDLDRGTAVLTREDSKGKRHRRVIYLSDEALEIVQRRKSDPIFVNTRGNAWTAFSMSNRFTRLKETVGRKIAAYDFRHSFVTRALKKGVDPVTLATIVGHQDVTMISRIYSHLADDPEFMRAQVARITD
jgi:integrase